MSERRTERVREILDLAMERPSGERAAFVAGASGGDAATCDEVMSLLAALEGGADVLDPQLPAGEEPEIAEPLTGLTFGPFTVGERIGQGGMGVVYAAQDTRLARQVAVKSLPPLLARDPHRRARLEQEARLLASLNHPNIAAIYGVEETPRGLVLVLEMVPGRTLAEEMSARQFTIEDAVSIAVQIARGLEAAHAAGIVHRDLKPANIKITPQGLVKILDLGVAKGAEPRVTSAVATLPGLIVGSAAYMSPEQARARPVDRRTDLWAFGCVLYEMLAGARAFDGGTSSDTLAAVLRSQPDWDRLPAGTPSNIRRVLARCLEKDADRRLRDAGDAALELESPDEPSPTPSGRRFGVRAALLALSIIAVACLAISRVWSLNNSPSAQLAPVATAIEAGGPLVMSSVAGAHALSPDGQTLVFAIRDADGISRLYKRPMGAFDAKVIRGTEGADGPFFSPDGRELGFCVEKSGEPRVIKRVSLDEGPIRQIASADCLGASWGDDNSIIVSTQPGILYRFPASGGAGEVLLAPKNSETEVYGQPEILPGSKFALFTTWQKAGVTWVPNIEALELSTGARHVLLKDASTPRFARDVGMLVFRQGTAIMTAPMNLRRVAIEGEARTIVATAGEAWSYTRHSVSASGTLAFIRADLPWCTDLAWFRADGAFDTVYTGEKNIWTLRLSPDASKVAFTINHAPDFSMWVLDLARGNATRIFAPNHTFFPVWTPDGSRIAFTDEVGPKGPASILWTASDGSGSPETLYRHPEGKICSPTAFSPDGREMLIMIDTGHDEDADLFVVDLHAADRTARQLLPTPANRAAARFSPDGTLIAYASTETGRAEIYVHKYPALDQKIRVSTDGGERPTWSADGKRIFWRSDNRIFRADVRNTTPVSFGTPEVILSDLPGLRYDVAPQGDRFIMARPRGAWGAQRRIELLLHALDGAPGPTK